MTKTTIKKQASKTQISWMIAITVLLAASILFWFWYTKVYQKPYNVFWGTLGNNLSVDTVTRSSTRKDGSQQLTQVTDMLFSPTLLARTTVKLENTDTKESVTTETIGSATTDYLRYVDITSNKPQADKSAIGVWAKKDVDNNGSPQILPDALFGSVLMFGDLSSSQRGQIIDQLKATNAIPKYDLISSKNVNGRKIDSFNVSIDLAAYSKVYTDYLKMLGQEKLAAQIGEQQPGARYDFVLDVNVGSRVPVKLLVGTDGVELFSNVGGGPRFTTPQANMTITELQAKLSGN